MTNTPGTQLQRRRNRAVSRAHAVFLLLALIAFTPLSVAAEKRILLLRVTFSDAPTEPVSSSFAQSMADNEIEPFYRQMSFGTESFEITASTNAYALPKTKDEYTQNHGSILGEAKAAAAADYDLAAFTDVGVVFPRLPLAWEGRGETGAFYINGSQGFTAKTVAHEIGHTYGLFHANYWRTTDGSPIGIGTSVAYGDPFDVMGSGPPSKGHFSPRSKYRLGWLNDGNVRQVSTSGMHRLHCFDNPAANLTNTLAIKIPRTDGRHYWLGLRGQFLQTPAYSKGLYLTWDYDYWLDSHLIDLNTVGTGAFDAPLQENGTFNDTEEGISIRIGKIQGTGTAAYVDVTITITRPERPVELWGLNVYSQNIPPPRSDALVDVAVASKQSIGLLGDGTVVQWGRPFENILPPEGLVDVVRVAASEVFGVALRADGTARHWGLSFGHTIEAKTDIIEITAGSYHVLALHADGTVSAHGSNETGQSSVPRGLKGVVAIAAGKEHSLALRADGSVVAWGRNQFGQGTVPPDLVDVVAIACKSAGNVALKADGSVVEWGYVVTGNLPWVVPKPASLGKVRRIAAGSFWVLAQLEDGTLAAWGSNSYGQCSLPTVAANNIRSFSAGGDNGAIISGSPKLDPFPAWRIRHRISVLEPLNSDRDQDGFSLLEEYAYGGNPRAIDPGQAVTVAHSSEEGGLLTFRASSRAADVTVQLEVSSDLRSWRPAEIESIQNEGDIMVFRHRPESNLHEVFGRLSLRLTP